ncbi:hypothetical protein [Phyllobacterium sp. K27]
MLLSTGSQILIKVIDTDTGFNQGISLLRQHLATITLLSPHMTDENRLNQKKKIGTHSCILFRVG